MVKLMRIRRFSDIFFLPFFFTWTNTIIFSTQKRNLLQFCYYSHKHHVVWFFPRFFFFNFRIKTVCGVCSRLLFWSLKNEKFSMYRCQNPYLTKLHGQTLLIDWTFKRKTPYKTIGRIHGCTHIINHYIKY